MLNYIPALLFAPKLPAATQLAFAKAIGIRKKGGLYHPVGAEMSEPLPQLAPGDDQPCRLIVAQDDPPFSDR